MNDDLCWDDVPIIYMYFVGGWLSPRVAGIIKRGIESDMGCIRRIRIIFSDRI